MQDERPAPPITISDPNNPGGYVDLLGSGDDKEPWRPSRRQLRGLLAVALALLVAVPPTLWLKHRGDLRAADRAALAAVRLEAANDEGEPFWFRNVGPTPVTVLSARIDRDGYRSQQVGTDVAAGDTFTIPLSFQAPCPTVVPLNGPSGVLVTVRARGGERTLRVDIRDSNSSQAFLGQIQDTCGLYSPSESVAVDEHTVTVSGRTLVVEATIFNRSVQRRDVTALKAGEGFGVTVAPSLPLRLRRAAPGVPGDSVKITARVSVADCTLALRNFGEEENHDGGYFPYALAAAVSNPEGDRSELVLGGGLFQGDDAYWYLDEVYAQGLQAIVDASC